MKNILVALILCGMVVVLVGCGKSAHEEERVIRLPPDDPKTTWNMAASIGQNLITNGLDADVQKQFPKLTPKQLSGLYLTWTGAEVNGERRFFIKTGIRYAGSLRDADKIADYLKSRVEQAIAKEFPNYSPQP